MAHVGPARMLQRLLKPRPIEFPIAQQRNLRPAGLSPLTSSTTAIGRASGKCPSGFDTPARPAGGSTFIDYMDHRCGASAAHAAAIHDEHKRLQGEMTKQDVRIGEKICLLQDVGVVESPRKAFDAAFG